MPYFVRTVKIDPTQTYVAVLTDYFFLCILNFADGSLYKSRIWDAYEYRNLKALPFSLEFDSSFRVYLNCEIDGIYQYFVRTSSVTTTFNFFKGHYIATTYTSKGSTKLSEDEVYVYFDKV